MRFDINFGKIIVEVLLKNSADINGVDDKSCKLALLNMHYYLATFALKPAINDPWLNSKSLNTPLPS